MIQFLHFAQELKNNDIDLKNGLNNHNSTYQPIIPNPNYRRVPGVPRVTALTSSCDHSAYNYGRGFGHCRGREGEMRGRYGGGGNGCERRMSESNGRDWRFMVEFRNSFPKR